MRGRDDVDTADAMPAKQEHARRYADREDGFRVWVKEDSYEQVAKRLGVSHNNV